MTKASKALLEQLTSFIKANSEGLEDVQIERAAYDDLKKYNPNLVDKNGDMRIDGMLIKSMPDREVTVIKLLKYVKVRWHVHMQIEDMQNLTKALSDKELLDMGAIVVDQHMDDLNVDDPIIEMGFREYAELVETLTELGIEHTQL